MKKILIIEDHADMRELLAWQIELMGFMPISAKQGREGVEKALAEKPQLIIMDIMMPGMDGWEAAKQIRAHPDIKDISDFGSHRAIPRLGLEKLYGCRL